MNVTSAVCCDRGASFRRRPSCRDIHRRVARRLPFPEARTFAGIDGEMPEWCGNSPDLVGASHREMRVQFCGDSRVSVAGGDWRRGGDGRREAIEAGVHFRFWQESCRDCAFAKPPPAPLGAPVLPPPPLHIGHGEVLAHAGLPTWPCSLSACPPEAWIVTPVFNCFTLSIGAGAGFLASVPRARASPSDAGAWGGARSAFSGSRIPCVRAGLGGDDPLIHHVVTMRVDGLKFLDTSQLVHTAQSLVFGKDGGAQENPAISKEITLPDAEDVDKQAEISKQGGCPVPPFVPYTATVPWHSGTRNLFSRFFPRYGNYCGPNYSSGRESGSLHWDKPPTDWLDHCCYRHDMGYDTLDQAKLHHADKQFLNCLQNIPESAKISTVGSTYRNLYLLGLQRFLLPYRDILVKKIEEGKRGRETAPEVIVEEVNDRNVDMNRRS